MALWGVFVGCVGGGWVVGRNQTVAYVRVGKVVIALSPTKFVLWPRSHTRNFNSNGKGFYALKPEDLTILESIGSVKTEISAAPGDVLFFLGGKIVHGSPGIADSEGARFATYAHWIPPDAQ